MRQMFVVMAVLLLGLPMAAQAQELDIKALEEQAKRFTLSGLIEVEAAYVKADGNSASDLVLATAELGLGVKLTEEVAAQFTLLAEEEADAIDLSMDQAFVFFEHDQLFGSAGLMYIPFGRYETFLVSDPLTLELGESQEVALMAGYNGGIYQVSAFVYKGDAEKDGASDHINDFGVAVDFQPSEAFLVGASLITDLADTDAELADDYSKRVVGFSVYAVATWVDWTLAGEYLGALREFDEADDLLGTGAAARPEAWNLELAYALTEAVTLAGRYEGSRDVAGQPENQYGAAVSWDFLEGMTLALEYLRGDFDEEVNGFKHRDQVTLQLAAGF